MKWNVPYVDLAEQFRAQEQELTAEFARVMSQASFILRDDVDRFEKNMASYLGVKHVVGVNSGTDALYLSVRALGLDSNDEVITVAHSFVATIAAIVLAGAHPVLADIGEDFNMDVDKAEALITEQTKAIIPVHLNGRMCDMDKLTALADKYNLLIIEDAAQALGALYKGKKAGSFGSANCFSVHPMKTLSCAGDGGFVATNDDRVAERLQLMRNHGQKTKTDIVFFGYSSRLDNLQAAILNIKFKLLDGYISRRREIAAEYCKRLADLPLRLPPPPAQGDYFDTFNSYVIRTSQQQALFTHLRDNGIEAWIHIAKPLHQHRKLNLSQYHLPVNEQICGEIISLPVHPGMTSQQVDFVIESISAFFKKS